MFSDFGLRSLAKSRKEQTVSKGWRIKRSSTITLTHLIHSKVFFKKFESRNESRCDCFSELKLQVECQIFELNSFLGDFFLHTSLLEWRNCEPLQEVRWTVFHRGGRPKRRKKTIWDLLTSLTLPHTMVWDEDLQRCTVASPSWKSRFPIMKRTLFILILYSGTSELVSPGSSGPAR